MARHDARTYIISDESEYAIARTLKEQYLDTPALLRPLYALGYEANLLFLRRLRLDDCAAGYAYYVSGREFSRVVSNDSLDRMIVMLERNRPWKRDNCSP